MLTVRVYDNYNLIALQDLDTDDIEGCEFSKKFRAESSGDMEKLMACVGRTLSIIFNKGNLRSSRGRSMPFVFPQDLYVFL